MTGKPPKLPLARALAQIETIGASARSGRPLAGDELEVLFSFLGDRRKPLQRAAAEVCSFLVRRFGSVRGRLSAELERPHQRRSWGAAFALWQGGDRGPATHEALIDFLAAADPDVRWTAAQALSQAASQSASLALRVCEVAVSAPRTARIMALYCLRAAGRSGPEVEGAVAAGLEARDARVRVAALAALSKLPLDPGASSRRVMPLLHDRDKRVCRAAAAALGALGSRDGAVAAALEVARASADPALRRAALRSLRLLSIKKG